MVNNLMVNGEYSPFTIQIIHHLKLVHIVRQIMLIENRI